MLSMTFTPSPRTVALGLAVALALGTGTVAVAGAGAAGDAPAGPSATPAKQAGPSAGKRAQPRADRQAAFAKELGVSTAEVTRARKAVRAAAAERRTEREKQRAEATDLTVGQLRDQRADAVAKRLAKAVEKGRITQVEADAVVQAARTGEPWRPALKQLRAGGRVEHKADRRADRKERRADRKAQKALAG